MAGHSSLRDVFTKASDDTFVEYFLYPDETIRKDADKLKEFVTDIAAEAVRLIGEYIWMKDAFYVKLEKAGDHLYGTLQYDASVEDEWFTVYILQQLTQKFPGLVARAVDQDGEFLLIEAAEHLPDWAESDAVCQQRVYIYKGRIHLVGEVSANGDVKASPKLGPIEVPFAINLIRQYPDQTLASAEIQQCIWKRVGKYPERMFENFHHISLFMPPKVAMILMSRPSFVSAAVRAYHYKDSIDMKATRLMSRFSPIETLVKRRVRFTKTLYAMISSQEYFPDSKIKWKFPIASSPDYKAHSLGAKLTLGFEILMSRFDAKGDTAVKAPTSAWLRYEEKLKEYNYYKGLLEGSREYKELEEKAKVYFQGIIASDLDSGSSDDAAIREINAIMSYPLDAAVLSAQLTSLPDDDDSWMDVTSDDLESLLEAQFKSKISDQKLDQIPEKLKEFMSQMSDFSGVEVHNGSDHGGSGDDEDEDGGLDPLDFRADDFVSAMDKLLLELGKPSHELDLSEPSSEEEENEQLKEIRKKLTFAKDSKIHQLMGQMDDELSSTEIGKTFKISSTGLPVDQKQSTSQPTSSSKYEPVDIDMNALAGMLESFQSQEDPTGPSANLLRNVGFDIAKAAKK